MKGRKTMNQKVHIKLTAGDIWLFSMVHCNRGFLGIFNLLFTGGMYFFLITRFAQLDTAGKLVIFLLANMFLVVQPLQLYLKSARQAASPVLKQGLILTFQEEGLEVSQGEEQAFFPWEGGLRTRFFGGMGILYTDRIHAYLLPRRYLLDQGPEIINLLKTKTKIIRW